MADYNEDGTPIDTPDTAPVETGVASDIVTIVAPSLPSLMGLLVLIGAIWYFSPKKAYFDEDE